MKKQIDIVISGDNLHAALLSQKAVNDGYSVVYIKKSEKDLVLDNKHFIIFRFIPWFNFLKYFRQRRYLQHLKKTASFLLLFTKIEEYKKLTFFELLSLYLYNIFSPNKVNIHKIINHEKNYRLTYSSYKISVKRLQTVILKSLDQTKFEIITSKKSFVTQEKTGETKILLDNKAQVFAKNFTDTRETSNLNESLIYFTYPSKLLKLEKTILYKNKRHHLQIIPWFEWVYFEFSGKDTPETLKKSISLIKKHLPEINLKQENVGLFKIIESPDENVKAVDKKKLHPDIFSLLLKMAFHRNSGTFTGSKLNIPYHPLRIMEYCDEKYDEAKHILQNPQYFKKLFYRYGTEIEKITYQAYEFWNQTKDIKKTWLMAEIWYVINYEQCTSAEEFIYQHTEEWMNGQKTDKEQIKIIFEELTNKK